MDQEGLPSILDALEELSVFYSNLQLGVNLRRCNRSIHVPIDQNDVWLVFENDGFEAAHRLGALPCGDREPTERFTSGAGIPSCSKKTCDMMAS